MNVEVEVVYECPDCGHRAASIENEEPIDVCPQCNAEMKNRSVPPKGWLLE
ncbi:rubrerythrin-like domain-containing protein [Halococcus thailandensis]|uniref:rubrerythrin-like domain-containing protein n=1 Tax=Halococcus thailandensis TaxID=335952 RepID=UPI0012680C13